MTDQQHPTITPPWDLKQQWREQAPRYRDGGIGRELWLMDRSAQWGADQELEATLAEVSFLNSRALADRVRSARRPKPLSLKEQALEAMREMQIEPCIINGVDTNAAVRAKYETIRRALEALPDD